MIKFDEETTITITNGSFNKFSSSSAYPYKVSSFTTSGNSTPEMKTGAINVNESDYAKNYSKYGLTEFGNPGKVGSDNYVLMINADRSSNYTYTSTEFTLPANGHYYITVSAKTIGNSAIASVFLTQNDVIFNNCLIENINSTSWSNYTFFVSTNAYEQVKLKFGMQIGSQNGEASGVVLFDELHAGQISKERLDNCVATFPTNSFKQVELRSPNAYKGYNFDKKLNESGNYFNEVTSGSGNKNYDIANNQITLNSTNSYITFKGEEEVLQPSTTYRFSIFANASKLSSGSAFVKLNEILDENEEYDDFMESDSIDMTAKSSKLTISSVTSNKVNNGYEEYTIYVHTGPLNTSKVQFSFGLGDENDNATGTVSFKSYTIERVPYSAYSSASAGDKVGKIDISERLTLSSNEYSNYTFDKMQSNSFDGVAYPASPTSWTKNSNDVGTQISGVVNLSAFDSVMTKYKNEVNTIATPSVLTGSLNNNVLMIYNGTTSSQSYTSASKSLTANKYYKITAFVNTYMWDVDATGITITAKVGSDVLGKVTNIKTAGEWQRVEFYINTASSAVSVTLELGLQNSSGYAFFDNILVEESETANQFSNRFNEFEVAKNGKIELDLTNPMLTSTTTREYNIPVLYVGENKGETTVNAGVVDLTSDLKMVAESKRGALRSLEGSDKALAIASAIDKDSYYEYVSLLTYSFASETYYKVSFDVFTDGLGQNEKDEKYDNGVLAEGVNIELTNLENATFGYIKSEGQWAHYEFYIGIETSVTSNLIISLGSEFTGCYGKAFIGNINMETVEEDVFKQASAGDTILKINTVKEESEETPETETTNTGAGFSWVYIPTIATFVAIVAAVVGVFVRRNIKFKKRTGRKIAEYDRDITVLQNKYRRIASDTRDKEVRELTKECNELIALRTEYEEKYKDALARLRSTRLANRDGSKRHEIVAIEHEVKHISKEVARFGVQINNYENEIEFMQTEAYLIDLEKRMMREDTYSRKQVLKESQMSEEDRAEAVAKREAKQQAREEKAQAKADKLASKQEKLKQEREKVQIELEQAKALDEKYIKEQELKTIKLEEIKLAKQQAKAEQELKKLERKKENQAKALKEQTAETENGDTSDVETEVVETENTETTQTEQAEVIETEQTENVVDKVENNEGAKVEQTENIDNAEKLAENTEVVEQTEQVKATEQAEVVETSETQEVSTDETSSEQVVENVEENSDNSTDEN